MVRLNRSETFLEASARLIQSLFMCCERRDTSQHISFQQHASFREAGGGEGRGRGRGNGQWHVAARLASVSHRRPQTVGRVALLPRAAAEGTSGQRGCHVARRRLKSCEASPRGTPARAWHARRVWRRHYLIITSGDDASTRTSAHRVGSLRRRLPRSRRRAPSTSCASPFHL